MTYISGAMFEDYQTIISRDILDSVFHTFSSTVYYVITFLISRIQKPYLERRKILQKRKHHSPVF